MDIMAALNASPARGKGRCTVARFLDSIPEDTDGREELIRLVETVYDRTGRIDTRPAKKMAQALSLLGCTITEKPVLGHRNHDCACFWG